MFRRVGHRMNIRRALPRLSSLFVGLALAAFAVTDASALRRVALVVGNAKYEHAGVLANTLNDAHAVAALLRRAKFDVVEERDDLGVVEMKRAMRDFAAIASNADIAVIYYSGHGIEAAGVNYLIPVDAKLANAYDVEDETLPLDRLLSATSGVKSLSLIILDACRENPFLRGGDGGRTRGVSRHTIGEQATAANTLIAYAAKAGSVSYDGVGRNSPFTTALVRHIAEPGVDIRIALGEVRDDVLSATGDRQEPYVYGSLGGEAVSLAPGARRRRGVPAQLSADYAMAERIDSPTPGAPSWRRIATPAITAISRAPSSPGWRRGRRPARRRIGLWPRRPSPSSRQPTPTRTISPTPVAKLEQPTPTRTIPPTPVAKLEQPPAVAEDPCRAESVRLSVLRNGGSATEISAFAAEMSCAALKPQLARLMESAGLAAPAPAAKPTLEASRHPEVGDCAAQTRELDALRAEPDAAAAKALADRLTCGALRPQLRRIMESLGLEMKPDAANSQRGAPMVAVAPPADSAADEQAHCVAELGKLSRLRAVPDRAATLAFAAAMRCDALKPQVARLLESLGP